MLRNLTTLLALLVGTLPMMSDRLPPQNLEAERGVLGAMVLDCGVIDDVLAVVAEGDFYRDSHATLFAAIRDLWHDQGQVDVVLLGEHLHRHGLTGSVGGIEAVLEIIESVPHAANATYYAEIVRQKAVPRRLIEAANAILRAAYANDSSAAAQLAEAQKLVLGVSAESDDRRSVPASVAADESMEALNLRRAGNPPGLPTGLVALDRMASLEPGQVAILAARPSMGKSALGVQVCQHLAIDGQKTVLLFSLEMTRREMADRILIQRSRVSGHHFREAAGLSGDQMALVGAARLELARSRLHISDRIGSVASLASEARRVRAGGPLDLVAIDYVQLLDSERRRGDSRQDQTAEISAGIKALARDLGVPVLAISQLNRQAEGRADHKPMMSDLRESGAWEQDAHHVWLLYRPDYYDPSDRPGTAELIVAKNRSGATGTVRFAFDKPRMWFADYDEPICIPIPTNGVGGHF